MDFQINPEGGDLLAAQNIAMICMNLNFVMVKMEHRVTLTTT